MNSPLLKAFALTACSLSLSAALLAQTQSIKETERFVKNGDATIKALDEAHLKTQAALDAYNALVNGNGESKSMKDDYKRLQKSEKTMLDAVADARKTIDDMDKQAAVYFSGRTTAIGQIQDLSLRAQAKSRIDDSQKGYDEIKTTLRSAGDALTPFSKDLTDHISYLGAELTPSAAASLKPQAVTLNAGGEKLFAQIAAAVATASKYFDGLRTQ